MRRLLSIYSVKNKILISYFFPILVPMLMLLGINYYQSVRIIEKNAMAEFTYVVESARQQLDQYILDIAALSYNVYETSAVRKRFNQKLVPIEHWRIQQVQDAYEMRQYLYGLYKLKTGISSITLYGLNGIIDYFHNDRIWNEGFLPSQEDWYQNTLNSDGRCLLSAQREEWQYVTTYHPTPEHVVTFSRLVRDLDTLKPLAVLCINIRVETLEKIVLLETVPYHMMIRDQRDEIILESNGNSDVVDSSNRLTAVSVSTVTGWEISYMTNKAELFRQSNDLRILAVVSILGISGLAFLLANMISSGIVRPIKKLISNMEAIDSTMNMADISEKGKTRTKNEISVLEERYNLMLHQIQGLLEENRLKEAQKSQIMLNALQARINPHFLYNTLNGIRMVALEEGNGKTAKQIESLVYLLRFSFKNSEQMITVHQESVLLLHYLKIMQVRSDNFDYEINIMPDATLVGICPFTLQPIVENAIFHGITPLAERGWLQVSIDCDDEKVYAIIQDNGVGMSKTAMEAIEDMNSLTPESQGPTCASGIANVLSRLKLQFGSDAKIHVSQLESKGVIMRLEWKKISLSYLPREN